MIGEVETWQLTNLLIAVLLATVFLECDPNGAIAFQVGQVPVIRQVPLAPNHDSYPGEMWSCLTGTAKPHRCPNADVSYPSVSSALPRVAEVVQ